jgi:hypothetical protein
MTAEDDYTMTPVEKARFFKSITSEYMQTDDQPVLADEALDLLTDSELVDLQVTLNDGSEQVARYREKRGLIQRA